MNTEKQKNICNTCDAAGIKLRKTAGSITTDYFGNFIYENGSLKYIITDYGKINHSYPKNGDTVFTRQYNLTNHLDNVRVTFDVHNNNMADIVQEDSYYPFGKTMNGLDYRTRDIDKKNLYLYNGKELQEDFGLDWYDYGARFYDAQLGRWHVVDPLADQYYSWSPYNYTMNNPIKFIDPTGMFVDDYVFDQNGDFVRIDENDKPDKLVVENSETKKQVSFNFADPENDTKAIRDGTVNKVVFVGSDQIEKMLGDAGAMSSHNRENEWDYMKAESTGGGKLDFSYSVIPTEFADEGASQDPLRKPSPMLFIPIGDTYAHNHMNFGNFLWGAAGHSLGFSEITLKGAAHYNSIKNSETNGGYSPQFDSKDDQISIGRGVKYSQYKDFRSKTRSMPPSLPDE